MNAFLRRTALAYEAHRTKWMWGQSSASIFSSVMFIGFELMSLSRFMLLDGSPMVSATSIMRESQSTWTELRGSKAPRNFEVVDICL